MATMAQQFDPLWFCGAGDEAAQRQATIATAAYYRAQQRGFAPGHEFEDWLAAEREVYRLIAGAQSEVISAHTGVVEPDAQRVKLRADNVAGRAAA
jgi:hypothetical protein